MSAKKQKTDAQIKADLDAKQRAKEAAAAKRAEHAAELDKPIEPAEQGASAEAQADTNAERTGQGDAFIPPAAVEPSELNETAEAIGRLGALLTDLEKRIDALERGLKGLGAGAKRRKDDGTHVGSIDDLGKI